jgi:hypothetical protein
MFPETRKETASRYGREQEVKLNCLRPCLMMISVFLQVEEVGANTGEEARYGLFRVS